MKEVMVALVTPFTKEGKVDYPALRRIVHRLLQEGCDGFIVCGTTAETPTLTKQEKERILDTVIAEVEGAVPLWYGCGSNDTLTTIQACKAVEHKAIAGVLLVTPYYNKPSQEGLFAHYDAIAASCKLNILLYNVPGRCGVSLHQETIEQLLKKHKNIVGLKQASNDLDTVRYLKAHYPAFLVYSGEDGSFDEGMDAGMDGLISVMGHVAMEAIQRFVKEGRKDNVLRKQLYTLARLCFAQASPSPVKYMLNELGDCENVLRLPLVGVNAAWIQEYKSTPLPISTPSKQAF